MTSTLHALSRPALRRGLIGTALAGAAILLVAIPASAHIVVTVPGGTVEGMGNLNFQVHNESETATAVKVSIDLPLTTPFAEVNPFFIPNWTATKTESKLPAPVKVGDFNLTKAVSNITWTAASGTGLPPGEIQNFMINTGPFPSSGMMEFPLTVTLSDGTTVQWNQAELADGSEPEFPTPSLDAKTIVAADMAMGTPTPSASPSDNMSTSSSSDTSVGFIVAIVALAVALVALVVAFLSRRKPSA